MSSQENKLIILTAPSGAGKTSITRFLIDKFSRLSFSISATTRLPRGTEKNGVEYYFISVDDFHEKIHANAFIEWEMVYEGKYYGTLKAELQRIWDGGKVPVLDIDVKGAIHVQEQLEGDCLSIFIQPPSIDELKRRLESRGTESAESLATRISKASYELSFKHHFNRIIVNDHLEKACAETEAVIKNFLGW
ncbi:guanylate kinase [Sediminibacterium soli]|uniref:guanylate kinase n=1 Tax=Sediminibacterium soli TaxID=2698829 RepID=UPI00137B5672|nr:guanylate kinase [Sediminibacterium soli]NCI45141.1 guanylate kinase [Sediminibacterium soli]